MGKLALYLLGDLRIKIDNEPVENIATEKTRALLVYLALESERPLHRDVLAEMFWPERPPGVGRASLRQAIGSLRSALGDRHAPSPFIIPRRDSIRFNADENVWIDSVRIHDLLQTVWDHGHQPGESCLACETSLAQALDLYKGDFLAEFSLPDSQAFGEWTAIQREALHRQISTAQRLQVSLLEARGAFEEACRYARELIRHEPWSEGNHRILMRLLAINGQRSQALRQFKTCQRILRDEFGAKPAGETLALHQQIQAGQIESLKAVPVTPPIDLESKTIRRTPRWLRYSLMIVGTAALIASLGLGLRNLSVLGDTSPSEFATSTQDQPHQEVGLPTGAATLGEIATSTLSPIPMPIPCALSVLVTGEGDAPITGASVTLDGVDGENGTQMTDDRGMVSWSSVPGETVHLSIGAQGYFPIHTTATMEGGDKLLSASMERDPHGILSSEACAPGEELIYVEDFQDNDATGWSEIKYHAQGWELIPHPESPDNIVARNRGAWYRDTFLDEPDLDNAVWRFWIMIDGQAPFNIWWAHSGYSSEESGYFVGYDPETSIHGITRVTEGVWLIISTEIQPIEENVWHKYEVSYYEGRSEVWMDDSLLLAYQDPYPFPGGRVGIFILHYDNEIFTLYFDGITICKLNAPFAPMVSPVSRQE